MVGPQSMESAHAVGSAEANTSGKQETLAIMCESAPNVRGDKYFRLTESLGPGYPTEQEQRSVEAILASFQSNMELMLERRYDATSNITDHPVKSPNERGLERIAP